MTAPVPDAIVWRRVAQLEKQVAAMEGLLRRMSLTRHTQTLASRTWRVKLNEAFGATTAEKAGADLLELDGTDTDKDITVEDPLGLGAGMRTDDEALVEEQIDLDGSRWFVLITGGPQMLVELCAQATATRNTPYTALLGTWDPDEGIWCYDDAPTVYAIDHRIGMPLAEEGFKGLYQAMPSTTPAHNGTLYVCVSLDCELPPEGCNECEEA